MPGISFWYYVYVRDPPGLVGGWVGGVWTCLTSDGWVGGVDVFNQWW